MQEKDYRNAFENLKPSDESLKSTIALCKDTKSSRSPILKASMILLCVCILISSIFVAFYERENPVLENVSTEGSFVENGNSIEGNLSIDDSEKNEDFKNGVKQLYNTDEIVDKINQIDERNEKIKETFSYENGTQHVEGVESLYGSCGADSSISGNDFSGGASMATPSYTFAESAKIQTSDYIKYSGEYIYRIGFGLNGDDHILRIFKADGQELSVISKTYIDILGIEGILIHGNVLIVYGDANGKEETTCALYDVSDPYEPKFINKFIQEGTILSCTVLDGKLYLITSYHINIPIDIEDTTGDQASATPEEPVFDADVLVPEFNNEPIWDIFPIYLTEASQSIYHTVISLIDIEKKELVSGISVLGNIDNVFQTKDSLYLFEAISPYQFESLSPELIDEANLPTNESKIYKIENIDGTLEITAESSIIGSTYYDRNIKNTVTETEDCLLIFARALYANIHEIEYNGETFKHFQTDKSNYIVYLVDKESLEIKQQGVIDFGGYIHEFIYHDNRIFLSSTVSGKSQIYYFEFSEVGIPNIHLSYETDWLQDLNMLRTTGSSELYYGFSYFGDGYNLVNPPDEDGLMIHLLDFKDPYAIRLIDVEKINYEGYTSSSAYSNSSENLQTIINPKTHDLSIMIYDHIGPEFLVNPAYYCTIGIENDTITLKSDIMIGTDDIANNYVRIFLRDDYCYLFNRDYAFVIDVNTQKIISQCTASDRFE